VAVLRVGVDDRDLERAAPGCAHSVVW
jgi:hypothetical protein